MAECGGRLAAHAAGEFPDADSLLTSRDVVTSKESPSMHGIIRPLLYLLAIAAVLAVLYMLAPEQNAARLNVHDARTKLDDGRDAIFVDVRTPDEYMGPQGHIPESILIPLQDLEWRTNELDAFRDHELILVCRTQNRSAEAAQILRDAGFERLSIMQGGMLAWREAGYPLATAE